jgi:hypothetical protein
VAKAKRSGFERRIAKDLTDRGVRYRYEPDSFVYYKKPYKPVCRECGSKNVASVRSYTPDFYLPDHGFYIETKGKFTPADRKKMQLVREANPEVDIRLVFMTDNKTTKTGTKRYSDWSRENGFDYSVGNVPKNWLE